MEYLNPEEMLIENAEIKELYEQFESKAELDKVIDYYRESSLDAIADGNRDMCEYYKSKVSELYEVRKEFVKEESKEWYNDFSKRMEKSIAETEELRNEIRTDKAIHGAPRYGGNLDYRESEWLYEADKELAKHGETAKYREYIENAAEAKAEADIESLKKYK